MQTLLKCVVLFSLGLVFTVACVNPLSAKNNPPSDSVHIAHMLDTLSLLLKEKGSPVEFNRGATDVELKTAMQALQIQFPQPVIQLYKWSNGTKTFQDKPAVSQWVTVIEGSFSSLDLSVKEARHYTSPSFLRTNKDFKKDYFPLLRTGYGPITVIDCNPSSPTYGMLLYYDLGSEEFNIVITAYDSFETFLQTVIEFYKRDIIFFKSNAINMTEKKWLEGIEIARKLNPRSEYWKSIKD
jgi:hypothetical protein